MKTEEHETKQKNKSPDHMESKIYLRVKTIYQMKDENGNLMFDKVFIPEDK